MDEKPSIFENCQPQKISNGVYTSHCDYTRAGADIASQIRTDKAIKIECKEATFTVHLHEKQAP